PLLISFLLSFFTAPATTVTYTLSLHDALPICRRQAVQHVLWCGAGLKLFRHPAIERSAMPVACFHEWLDIVGVAAALQESRAGRSEEHTSELQSPCNLVCRLLLEKKKKKS